jgi:hypothetical protein
MAESIESEDVVLENLSTEDMVADIMKKPLEGVLFRKT